MEGDLASVPFSPGVSAKLATKNSSVFCSTLCCRPLLKAGWPRVQSCSNSKLRWEQTFDFFLCFPDASLAVHVTLIDYR